MFGNFLQAAQITIIGGADGPTSIYVSPFNSKLALIVTVVLLLPLLVFGIYKLISRKRKQNSKTEKFDLYNFDRSLSGKKIERGNPVPDGYYRLVVVILIFNSKGELLIQHRQSFKKNWSNLWDVSSAGHVVAGETSQQGAARELKEELGIDYDFSNTAPVMSVAFPHGFNDFYVIHKDVDVDQLKLQEEEVQAVKWATKDEVYRMIDDGTFIPYNKGIVDFIFFQFDHQGTHTKADWTTTAKK